MPELISKMVGNRIVCPGCKKETPSLRVVVGMWWPKGSTFSRKVPVGRFLCEACFTEQGLPETVELIPALGINRVRPAGPEGLADAVFRGREVIEATKAALRRIDERV